MHRLNVVDPLNANGGYKPGTTSQTFGGSIGFGPYFVMFD